jgi:hypothetical protein
MPKETASWRKGRARKICLQREFHKADLRTKENRKGEGEKGKEGDHLADYRTKKGQNKSQGQTQKARTQKGTLKRKAQKGRVQITKSTPWA